LLGAVVAVDVDLGNGVEDGSVLAASLDAGLEPREDELEPVALLDLADELVDREVARDRRKKALDGALVAVDVEQTTNNLRRPDRVDALDVDLDEVGEAVLVQVKNEVVDKVETVANDDKGKLVGQLGLLEEVLDLLRVVVVALAADTLDLADLARARRRLDVLEVNLGVLADVHDRAEVVVQS
jgi:hypothetical protein